MRLGLGLGLGSGIKIMVSIRVWDWVIMVIFRWGHSDWGHFDVVPPGSCAGLYQDYLLTAGLNIFGREAEGVERAVMLGLCPALRSESCGLGLEGHQPWPRGFGLSPGVGQGLDQE